MSLSVNAAEPVSKPEKEQFRFFINADPQMGPEKTERKGLKILNELLENFVTEVNQENKKQPVDFVVYNGDLVWDPYQDAFDNFTRIVSKQEVPVKLVHGNHDGYDDDPKFFQTQKTLSGYEKLNYSFDYGNWHFVVVGAQEKYLHENQKKAQLAWLKKELTDNQDKQVMLFMHYHIMPVGLSQMEFYTYWPIEFKNQMLDAITEHGNVKYAFTGHVHVGVKASIKSSLEYKGTKFINSPTPVMARPFGEEYEQFEDNPDDRYFRRGFYLEVKVDGDKVEMLGRKIQHKFKAPYPDKFKSFKISMDNRFFKPESKTKPNKIIKNPSFIKGFEGWNKSYRYEKDKKPAFNNTVINGSNFLNLKAPWGSWSFDEYMETYQIIEFDTSQPNHLQYNFDLPKFSKKGGGGFFKLIFYDDSDVRVNELLLHWGARENFVKLMPNSFYFNSDGNRAPVDYLNKSIEENRVYSYPLKFDSRKNQLLNVNINAVLKSLQSEINPTKIQKVSIAHGVWSRVKMKESNIFSRLKVHDVQLTHDDEFNQDELMVLNNMPLSPSNSDKVSPYFRFKK